MNAYNKRSALWYLLPIFLGIIGGIIGYFIIRNDDPVMAKRILIIGVIISGISLVLVFMTSSEVPQITNTNN